MTQIVLFLYWAKMTANWLVVSWLRVWEQFSSKLWLLTVPVRAVVGLHWNVVNCVWLSVIYISENIILIFQIYFRLNSKLMLYVVTPRYYGWTRQIFFQINIIELDNLLENEASGYQPVNQWNMKKKVILPSLLLILSVQCSRYT